MINCLGSQHYMDNDLLPLNYTTITTRGVSIIGLANTYIGCQYAYFYHIGNQLREPECYQTYSHKLKFM